MLISIQGESDLENEEKFKERLAQIAWAHFVYEKPQAEIARSRGTNQTAINRLLKQAWDLGVIGYSIDPDFAVRARADEEISVELCEAFELKNAITLDTKGLDSDDIHIALANAAGENARAEIDSGDHVVVAGGRAIVRLAQVIGRRPKPCRRVVVTPLGGRLWFGKLWGDRGDDPKHPHLSMPLNADYSALLLANGLIAGRTNTGIGFSQISRPLYAKDDKEADELVRHHCAFLPGGAWNWNLPHPSKAFVGVGAVHPKSEHRIAEFLDSNSANQGGEAFQRIKAAMDFVEESQLPYFGDIANRLFPALPLPGEVTGRDLEMLTALYKRLANQLEDINRKAVVMEWQHLISADSVLVVAGGELKLNVLWTLLLASFDNPTLKLISDLATDVAGAKALILAKRDFDKLDDRTRGWYRNLIALFFAASARPARGSRRASDAPIIG